MDVKKTEIVIVSELLYHLGFTGKIQYVALPEDKVRRCKLLVYSTYKAVLACTSTKFKHIDSIFTVDIEVYDSLSDSLGVFILEMDTEKIFRDSILLDQFLQRLAFLFLVVSLVLRNKEELRCRKEIKKYRLLSRYFNTYLLRHCSVHHI